MYWGHVIFWYLNFFYEGVLQKGYEDIDGWGMVSPNMRLLIGIGIPVLLGLFVGAVTYNIHKLILQIINIF